MPVRKLLAYAAIYILWGGTFLAIREIVRAAAVPPFFAAGCRFFLAGLILFVWGRLASPIQITPRQFRSAVLLGLIMFTGDYAALFWAETRVASGLAAVVLAIIPVWIFAGELFVLRTQRATALASTGLVLGFAGVVLLSIQSGPAHSSTLAVLVMVAGTLCWSVGTLLSRHLPLPRPQQASAGLQMLTGGLFLLLLAAASGELRHLPPTAVLFSPRVLLSLAYLIVAGSMISFYAYVNPVIALILGALVAGERLTPHEIAGAALVLFGVFATLMGRGAKLTAPAKNSAELQIPD
jgi:drug/metabolite transporter (DMT)-like permease